MLTRMMRSNSEIETKATLLSLRRNTCGNLDGRANYDSARSTFGLSRDFSQLTRLRLTGTV
jgi:hypothetical protein